ncbi:hypothetical protein [Streptomyces jumonjinensis]|uniref:Uncharacterized protein n=1 Tax=Streptomyces jumonjinensis TaxID=1945 RepID=A0A646KG65_STRJU|nr:hypothetical protein [Streptomyces jumonjinensis]MQT01060.1 hypothetical protein [Streptomyces jumonjinensis]
MPAAAFRRPPPRHLGAQGYSWRCDFAHRIFDLARDIAAGTVPRPRCVAERVALDLALDRARAHTHAPAGGTPAYDELPEHHHDDWDRVDQALRATGQQATEGLPLLWRAAPDHWFIPFTKSRPATRSTTPSGRGSERRRHIGSIPGT